jgi:RNA polymerase-binding protein DksA
VAKKSRKKTTRKAKKSRKKSTKKSTRKSTGKKRKASSKKSARKSAKKRQTPKRSKSKKRPAKKRAAKKAKAKKAKARKRKAKKPKSPLSKAELKDFRQRLLAKRRDILGDMGGMQSGSAGVNPEEGISAAPSMPTHPADVGSDNFEHEFTLGLLQSERAVLQEIDEALERIANGTYGICLGTGKPINKARLRARPWARYCIEYARMVEKGLVRPNEDEERNQFEHDEDLDEDEEEEPEAEDDAGDEGDSDASDDEDLEDDED